MISHIHVLTKFASTCCCVSQLVTVLPTPQCPTTKAHLSLACKYFPVMKMILCTRE